MQMRAIFRFTLALFAAPFLARADVSLPRLFSDNMVLQQRTACPVWGWADPGEKVTVKLGRKNASATAGPDGRWQVKLDPGKSGGTLEMVVTGKNTITVKNVAVGEVWVCSGQSNMEFRMPRTKDAEKEMAAARFPMIRMFTVARNVAEKPAREAAGTWMVCDPQTVKDFSAVGYFFARDLHAKLKVPVGVIHASWGGTPAEAWTPMSVLKSNPALSAIADDWQAEVENYPQAKSIYEQQLAAWNAEAEKAKAAGQPAPPRRPQEPRGPGNYQMPGGLFNGMIAPLIPYSIRGVAWYQGESNIGRAKLYRELFPAMITGWRAAWGEGDFPFLFVQLPNYSARHAEPAESSWAELREAQAAALTLPKTGMAVTMDIGDEHNIHPQNKQEVGRRLALLAETLAYGKEDVVSSGPVFAGMKIEGNKAKLSFKKVDGGLADKDGPPLKGFQIAGADRRFVWADAKIEGGKVIVQSPAVPKPVAVRYAWADTPDCDLANKAGLLAPPFRTDDWERPQPVPAASASPAVPAASPSASAESASSPVP